jgi:hypothetical protein
VSGNRTPRSVDISAIPRAVLSAAAGMVSGVERAAGVQPRTARTNAWEAIQADQRRATLRAHLQAEVHELVASRATSPRARAEAVAVVAEGR